MSSILDVSIVLKFKIMSLINSVSCSLLGLIVSLDVWMISLKIGMSIKRGTWSEDRQESGRMEWLSSSADLYQRNIRSITELDSPTVSENLVGPELVREDRVRLKKSAIMIKSSLIKE